MNGVGVCVSVGQLVRRLPPQPWAFDLLRGLFMGNFYRSVHFGRHWPNENEKGQLVTGRSQLLLKNVFSA